MIDLLKGLLSIFKDGTDMNLPKENYDPIKLLSDLNCLEIDLFELTSFLEKSQVSRKIMMFSYQISNDPEFINKILTKSDKDLIKLYLKSNKCNNKSYFSAEKLVNFVIKLISSQESESQVILEYNSTQIDKNTAFLLPLNLKSTFKKLVTEPTSVLFTGGTMQPAGFLEELIASSNRTLILKSFGHVVDPKNLQLNFITSFNGMDLIFNHKNSRNISLFKNSIRIVYEIFQKTPGGVIVFLPSYSYLDIIKSTIISMMNSGFKGNQYYKLFVDGAYFDQKQISIFQTFESIIRTGKNAVLFSVMGGSLSEGINFKDKLARSVICIGLPYPNIYAEDLKLKMKYFDDSRTKEFNGQLYYESLCTKLVNQSIGRAIRHKNDYAMIFLVDLRYRNNSRHKYLPEWMMKSLGHRQQLSSASEIKAVMQEFFKDKN